MAVTSLPEIADVYTVASAGLDPEGPIDLLVEVPHGATSTADFVALGARLHSPLPEGLADFFHVNTDVGAPELGEALLARWVALGPGRRACMVRSRIPRSFVDCNRRLEVDPAAFREGRVTPGLMPWITDARDLALLQERHAAWVRVVRACRDRLTSRGGMLLLHTYAPREVDVQVDLDIVARLRAAWAPGTAGTWPLRPELDVIHRTLEGASTVTPGLMADLAALAGARGWTLGDSHCYPMHPSTLAWDHVMALPDRTLCLEVRRDLLTAPFDPFVQMTIDREAVDGLATDLAPRLAAHWGGDACAS